MKKLRMFVGPGSNVLRTGAMNFRGKLPLLWFLLVGGCPSMSAERPGRPKSCTIRIIQDRSPLAYHTKSFSKSGRHHARSPLGGVYDSPYLDQARRARGLNTGVYVASILGGCLAQCTAARSAVETPWTSGTMGQCTYKASARLDRVK